MPLHVYNVRTRQKEGFRPREAGKVGLYLCGLTVYDHVHLGHARTAVSFEIVRRWLERTYEGLRFVQNVTDVEDKIMARAAELGVSPREHAAKWDRTAREVMDRLGVRPPDEAPHVTGSIPDIVVFIEEIVQNGFAYVTDKGNVYFDVPKYDDWAGKRFPAHRYGCLSNRDYRQMAAGTRKDVEADKRHPADFALWKAAGEGDHPDASWPSPWSTGRPGWHIECSVMSTRALGDRIDIHGGGQDLVFPHHENEIAQSQAKTGQAPFVDVWMHTGFLNVEGQKMSKSLGNFIVLQEFLDEMEADGLGPEVLRFYFAQTHYRSKIDFSRNGLREAAKALERLHRTRRLLAEAVARGGEAGEARADGEVHRAAQALAEAFDDAMDDDFHTPNAIAALFAFARGVNPHAEPGAVGAMAAQAALDVFEDRAQVLSLFEASAAPRPSAAVPPVLSSALGELGLEVDGADEDQAMAAALKARQEARKAKDWGQADRIRDRLAEAGYTIEDTSQGPRWRRA